MSNAHSGTRGRPNAASHRDGEQGAGSGAPQHFYRIKHAESSDGIDCRTTDRVCVDFATDDEYAIARPCVIRDSDCYRMWFSYRGARYRIGYAESPDGLIWTRRDDTLGLDTAPIGFDSEMVEYPYVFDRGGTRHLLYNGNGYGRSGIGHATLSGPQSHKLSRPA